VYDPVAGDCVAMTRQAKKTRVQIGLPGTPGPGDPPSASAAAPGASPLTPTSAGVVVSVTVLLLSALLAFL
jgi:hypothetical protein